MKILIISSQAPFSRSASYRCNNNKHKKKSAAEVKQEQVRKNIIFEISTKRIPTLEE